MGKKLIKCDLLSLFNIKMIICTICMSILVSSYLGIKIKLETSNLIDYLIVLFAGPSINENTLLNFLVWFFPLIIFTYGIFNFLYCEWDVYYKYTILRCRSISKWILCKVCTFIIYSFLYLIIFYIVSFIIGIILGYSFSEGSNLKYFYINNSIETNIYIIHLLNILMVLLSLILISLISFFFSYILKKNIYGYLVLCLIYAEPYFLKDPNNKIRILFPAENSIFARHSVLDYYLSNSLQRSYVYLLVTMLIIICILNIFIKKFDLD